MSDICTEQETTIEKETKAVSKEPKMYRVIFHNDNVTPFIFVVAILQELFHKNRENAYELAQSVHVDGKAVVAVYSFEIAEQKRDETISISRTAGYPLQVTIEEEQ